MNLRTVPSIRRALVLKSGRPRARTVPHKRRCLHFHCWSQKGPLSERKVHSCVLMTQVMESRGNSLYRGSRAAEVPSACGTCLPGWDQAQEVWTVLESKRVHLICVQRGEPACVLVIFLCWGSISHFLPESCLPCHCTGRLGAPWDSFTAPPPPPRLFSPALLQWPEVLGRRGELRSRPWASAVSSTGIRTWGTGSVKTCVLVLNGWLAVISRDCLLL